MPNPKLVNKIHCSLPRNWEPKVTTILEVKGLAKLKLEQLIDQLKTHEMINSSNEKKKKKASTLKVSIHNNDDDDIEMRKFHYFPANSNDSSVE